MNRKQIGISSWTLPWAVGVKGCDQLSRPLGAMELLTEGDRLGAGVLQIADNLPLHDYTTGYLLELGKAARGCGMALEVGTRGLWPDVLTRYLEIAQILGANLVRTLPHDGGDRPDMDEAQRRLSAVLPEYERAGVTLGVENHDFYHSSWLKKLVATAASPALGVCLDPVNNFGQGESEREVFRNLAPSVVNFHCKDYQIARKPTMLGFDVYGAPLGSGRLDLGRAKRVLKSGISWVIEQWTPWQGSIDATAALEKAWAQAGIMCLREL